MMRYVRLFSIPLSIAIGQTMFQCRYELKTMPCLSAIAVCCRTGYIESWGRGIQKIIDACKNLGADDQEYIVSGGDIMVKFTALQSAKVPDSKAPKGHDEPLKDPMEEPLEEKILQVLRHIPNCTYDELTEALGVSCSTVKKSIKQLSEHDKTVRKGGKKYGYWEVHEE